MTSATPGNVTPAAIRKKPDPEKTGLRRNGRGRGNWMMKLQLA